MCTIKCLRKALNVNNELSNEMWVDIDQNVWVSNKNTGTQTRVTIGIDYGWFKVLWSDSKYEIELYMNSINSQNKPDVCLFCTHPIKKRAFCVFFIYSWF